MADTSSIAPDDDTYVVDSVFDYESFNRLFNEEDTNLANLTSINEVTAPDRPSNGFVRRSGEVPPSTGYVSWSGNGIADANANLNSISEATAPVPSAEGFFSGTGDSVDDPMILNSDNEFNQVNSLPVPYTIPVQNENGGAGDSDNTGYGWPSLPLPFWPPLPEPFRCSCCQVLRELVHTDGTVTTKLEIHGRLGMIHHAILEIRNKNNATLHMPHCHMFDFCMKSIEQVNQFLVKYCHERKVSGFVKVQDPFSGFYEAICVGMDIENSVNVNAEVDDFLDLSPTTSTGDGQIENLEGDNGTTNVPKTSLTVQRQRAAKLKPRDLADYFHLSIEKAAKKINLCPSVLKKICRREGVNRWSHRKIKSIEKRIKNFLCNRGHMLKNWSLLWLLPKDEEDIVCVYIICKFN